MSASPAGDEAAPAPPPIASNPFRHLVVPGLMAVLVLCGVIFGLLPMWSNLCTAEKNYRQFREDAARSQSQPTWAPGVPPPSYYPGNNPNGPFTPANP